MRDLSTSEKRPAYRGKETYSHDVKPQHGHTKEPNPAAPPLSLSPSAPRSRSAHVRRVHHPPPSSTNASRTRSPHRRGLCIWQKMAEEAYVYGKRGLCIWQKRPMYMSTHTMITQSTHTSPAPIRTRMQARSHVISTSGSPSLPPPPHVQHPPRDCYARDLPANTRMHLLYGKRDLLVWQKRPTCMAKETSESPTHAPHSF